MSAKAFAPAADLGTEDGPLLLDEPGLYDIPEQAYHRDPLRHLGGSLSSSIAKKLISPSCPAIARWEMDHPVHKDVFDLGSAAHKLVLGAGSDLVVVEADSWRGKAAQDAKASARAAGLVPLLPDDMAAAVAMCDAIHGHPIAGALLDPCAFLPERSIMWQDSGTWLRARPDALSLDGRPLIIDLKTTPSTEPNALIKSVYNFGYYMQATWYLEALRTLGIDDATFLFVFVQSAPPHLVTVGQLDQPALDEGAVRNRQAIDVWNRCRATDSWPGYCDDDIALIGLPRWAITNTREY